MIERDSLINKKAANPVKIGLAAFSIKRVMYYFLGTHGFNFCNGLFDFIK